MKNLSMLVLGLAGWMLLAGCTKESNSTNMDTDAGPAMDAQAECTPEDSKRCIDGHPTWTDSCGRIVEPIAIFILIRVESQLDCFIDFIVTVNVNAVTDFLRIRRNCRR